MASRYKLGRNPIQDFLMQSIIHGVDLLSKKNKADIYSTIIYILQYMVENPNELIYLDFDIVGDKDNIKLVGNNAISAIWLSGIYPDDIEMILNKSRFKIGDRLYRYNKKTKTLTYTIDTKN